MTQSPDQDPAPSAEPVRSPADGADLVGNLYHPSLRAAGQRLPAVVVSGTWTSVKEQMADRYAAELACRGLIALSFDFFPMAVDFYLDPNRGAVPGWPNRFAVMVWTEWLHFDPIALAAPVAVPTLIVHSEQAAVPDGARRFYESLACGKQIVWTGGTQTDFYDHPATVGHAAGRAAAHFARHLAAAGAAAGPAMQGAPR